MTTPSFEEWDSSKLDAAANALSEAVASGKVHAASLLVRRGSDEFQRSFGAAKSTDDIFLLASISKPISAAAVLTLLDRGQLGLDDRVQRFLPEFTGDGRERITLRHLLSHVSGLPDHVPENTQLRARHAALSEFVECATRTPLLFAPGTRYGYSSMGILLAAEVARRVSGREFPALVEESVFRPLGMDRSAMGLGRLDPETLMRCQVEESAPESGGGRAATSDWDWNSSYWRGLGAPWGGAHGSAGDVARFLDEFLHPGGRALKPQTARLMITNQNGPGIRERGLGFDIGPKAGGPECSPRTFGHGGSTGTWCWADPASDAICVVLTTLPVGALEPHPREVASDRVAAALGVRGGSGVRSGEQITNDK